MNNKPLILQCVREVDVTGGVAQVAYQLEKHLMQLGCKTERLSLETIGLKSRVASSSFLISKLWLLLEVLTYTFLGSWRLKQFRKKNPEAKVICHHDILGGDIYIDHGLHKALVYSKPSPLRFVLRNPLHLFLLCREAIRHRLSCYQKIITFSESGKKQLLNYYPHIPQHKIHIIPNGVDLDRFKPDLIARETQRKKYSLENKFILLFVGNEFERKGLNYIITSLSDLPKEVHLVVVGGTPSMALPYQKKAAQLNVADKITWTYAQIDVSSFYNMADLFILPTEAESWGLVAIEALASGTPILVTRVHGIMDFLKENHNGFFIERDSTVITARIQLLLQDKALYQRLKSASRTSVLQYAWGDITKQYLSLLDVSDSHA